LNKPSPQKGETKDGDEDRPLDERALTEIQKLLYGKANLADIIVQVSKIEAVLPKINTMRKDLDFLMR
jgi:hypothetical protein